GLFDRGKALHFRDGIGAGLLVRRAVAGVRRRYPAAVLRRGDSRISRPPGAREVSGSTRARDRGRRRRRTLAGKPRVGRSGAIEVFAHPATATVLLNAPRESRGQAQAKPPPRGTNPQ